MKRNWLEWVILAVSVMVVVGLVGYLLVAGFSNSGPAMIRAEIDRAQAEGGPAGSWLVPVTVHNSGGTAAVSITVEGTATVAGMEESSMVTIDVLAADSEVELRLGFSGEPDAEVTVRVVGYEIP